MMVTASMQRLRCLGNQNVWERTCSMRRVSPSIVSRLTAMEAQLPVIPAKDTFHARRSLLSDDTCMSTEFMPRFPLHVRPLSNAARMGGNEDLKRSVSSSGDVGSREKDAVPSRKRLDVAIVGAPNAGKSQLLNSITKSNVAAVSRKRHTTRKGILGARTVGDTQILFFDTPGYLHYKSARKDGVVRDILDSACTEIDEADYTLVVIDAAKKIDDDLREVLATLMLRAVHSRGRKEILLGDDEESSTVNSEVNEEFVRERFAIVFNKVDLVNPKEKLLDLAENIGVLADEVVSYQYRGDYMEGGDEGQPRPEDVDLEELEAQTPPVFFVSALNDDGVGDILDLLLYRATPSKQWLVDPNAATHMPLVERVEEVIREKIFRCLHREVPHHVRQINRSVRAFRRKDNGAKILRIDQDLVVHTESHRRLVSGRGSMTVKRIQDTAQRDLERVLRCTVHLHLHVKLTKSKHVRPLQAERTGVTQNATT